MKMAIQTKTYTATQNACNLCAPLGAALVFKGIANTIPLLHGSQGCSTYIRRYMISHFKEPLDIACSNFAEETAIFGGSANLKLALDNIRKQYQPELIGVATTCLSETIGDDVPQYIKSYTKENGNEALPSLVHVSTPSYQGTHMEGFHAAVHALVATLAESAQPAGRPRVNLFAGMVSPADLRRIKEMVFAFGLDPILVPDYSDTLNGPLWNEYQRIPQGGTPVAALIQTGGAKASLECGAVLSYAEETAGTFLEATWDVPLHRLPLPVGISATDSFFDALATVSGRPVPPQYMAQRGRLIDSLVDGHKHLNGVRAAIFGEEDLVAGLASFCSEIGIIPVLCATGGGNGVFADAINMGVPPKMSQQMTILEDVDFVTIEKTAKQMNVDLLIGHSKGYTMSRRLNHPLIRVGFPIHDRVDGSRLLHVGYQGAQQLFDRITNTLIEEKQKESRVGYTYY